jgi:two-component system, LytTR family, response regulator
MNLRTVVVDDDEPARRRMRQLLQAHQEIVVVDEADSGTEAVRVLQTHRPDLVFLDIHLPDFDGFEVLRRIDGPPVVVFTTAFDQYALRAFEAASVDYLLKPIEKEMLARALGKLERFRTRGDQALKNQLQVLLTHLGAPRPAERPHLSKKMAVRVGERVLLIDLHEVTHFEARDKYVFLRTSACKEYIVDKTIADLEQLLDPVKFIRVHRATIVNIDHIKEIQDWFGGKYRLVLRDQNATEVVVSKGMAGRLKAVVPF